MTKQKSILIVDDLEENRKAGLEGISRVYPSSRIEEAADYIGAKRIVYLEGGNLNLIFSDLFFPEDKDKPGTIPTSEESKRLFDDNGWQYFIGEEGNPPMGMLLQLFAQHKGLRCLIFSDGDRHFETYGMIKSILIPDYHRGNFTLQGVGDARGYVMRILRKDFEGRRDKTDPSLWEGLARYVQEYCPEDPQEFYRWA